MIEIVQKTAKRTAKFIKNFVIIGTPFSSKSFSFVETCHAMDIKLSTEIIGVINGKTNINKTTKAIIP